MIRFHEWRQQLWRGWRSDRLVRWSVGLAALGNGLTWLSITRLADRQSSLLPLHYTIYFGPDLTVPRLRVFLLPAMGLVIILSNLMLNVFDDHELWRRMMSIITLTLNVLLLATSLTLLAVIQSV